MTTELFWGHWVTRDSLKKKITEKEKGPGSNLFIFESKL